MSHHPPPGPPEQPRDRPADPAVLGELLCDAVSDVEPDHRLDSIRNRTKVPPMSSRRPWLYGVGGAAGATAAVIAAVAVFGADLGGEDDTPASSTPGQPATSAAATPETPAEEPSSSASEAPVGKTSVVPVYFAADAPQGPRLFREFQKTRESDLGLAAATLSVTGAADDPDYRTLWPAGVSVGEVTAEGETPDVVTVDLVPGPDGDLGALPQGMSRQEASLAIEQLLYTVQGALQVRAPVQLLVAGQPSDTVLGVAATGPLTQGDPLEVLALASITEPTEGRAVSGSFAAEGVASSFEATVPWEIRQGSEVVDSGFTTAEGWMDRLYPWRAEIDISALTPGQYTFVAMTNDPSGGEEGFGPTEDTRTIVVE